jgi:hypothetical protein
MMLRYRSFFSGLLLAVGFAGGLAGCSYSGLETFQVASLSVSFNHERKINQSSVQEVQQSYTRVQLEKALRIVAQILILRDPLPDEMAQLSEGIVGYERVVKSYLDMPEFRASQMNYYRNYFEMAGMGADNVNFDEPANLAVYLVTNDIDFREVLTADYCVNNNLEKIPCSSFRDPALAPVQAAGVLTTRAFLVKWSAPFNFRRVAKAFHAFSCREYPDDRDEGLLEAEISDNIKAFNSKTETPVCYNCHRSMNPRASLFYLYDQKGYFNLNPNPDPRVGEIAVTDTGGASTVRHILNPGVKARYHGKEVSTLRDYGQIFSRTQHFRDCVARRLTNQMLGRKATDPLMSQMQDIRDNVAFNEFKVKSILLEIAKHPGFVLR